MFPAITRSLCVQRATTPQHWCEPFLSSCMLRIFGLDAPAPGSITLAPGTSSPVSLAVRAAGSFTWLVTFSCVGLPSGVTCQFQPSSASPVAGLRALAEFPASGRLKSIAAAAGVGAVVVMLTVISELPLPEGSCAGLKLHTVNAGSPAQAIPTIPGKVPVLGFTARVKTAIFPRATATLPGAADMAKSKFWFGNAVNVTGAECVVDAPSTPLMLNA